MNFTMKTQKHGNLLAGGWSKWVCRFTSQEEMDHIANNAKELMFVKMVSSKAPH